MWTETSRAQKMYKMCVIESHDVVSVSSFRFISRFIILTTFYAIGFTTHWTDGDFFFQQSIALSTHAETCTNLDCKKFQFSITKLCWNFYVAFKDAFSGFVGCGAGWQMGWNIGDAAASNCGLHSYRNTSLLLMLTNYSYVIPFNPRTNIFYSSGRLTLCIFV